MFQVFSTLLLLVQLHGSVTYYGLDADQRSLMEHVYEHRLLWGDVQPCAECIGKIAVLDRQYLGKWAYLMRPGEMPRGPYLIVDCAAEQDRERLRQRGLVAEVSWEQARAWDMHAPLQDITVYIVSNRSTTAEQLHEGDLSLRRQRVLDEWDDARH